MRAEFAQANDVIGCTTPAGCQPLWCIPIRVEKRVTRLRLFLILAYVTSFLVFVKLQYTCFHDCALKEPSSTFPRVFAMHVAVTPRIIPLHGRAA